MRPTGTTALKDPDASLWPQGIDWTRDLAKIGPSETIATSTWVVTGEDALLVASSPSIVTGNLKTQVLLAGGTSGVKYRLRNRIVTNTGMTDDRSIFILIADR